ncbi:unnamed protein product [Schistosoma curassoni]|uniref:Secreted protein n=1 Tax=Schistosoma curassoni TaxID=6186 RepID=A0A183KB47_9TREM|nr:unnamed protein product [Schistosoma curassoni]
MLVCTFLMSGFTGSGENGSVGCGLEEEEEGSDGLSFSLFTNRLRDCSFNNVCFKLCFDSICDFIG